MPHHDFKCPAGHITTKHYRFDQRLPALIECAHTCDQEAIRQFYGRNMIITYSGDGMAPPSQRQKGTGAS